MKFLIALRWQIALIFAFMVFPSSDTRAAHREFFVYFGTAFRRREQRNLCRPAEQRDWPAQSG
jgi:hypothetical protein